MKISIEIDDSRIAELVENEIVKKVLDIGMSENRVARQGVRAGTEKAVREYIYEQKANIIDAVVKRASLEIVKKGLPKLLAELGREK